MTTVMLKRVIIFTPVNNKKFIQTPQSSRHDIAEKLFVKQ